MHLHANVERDTAMGRLFYTLLLSELLVLTAVVQGRSEEVKRVAEDDSSEGSTDNRLQWVTYNRRGMELVAGNEKVQVFAEYLASKPFSPDPSSFETQSTFQMEDGPEFTDPVKHNFPSVAEKSTNTSDVSANTLQRIAHAYYNPEYAIGLLDNGCTAFLISPQHALTAAQCVYNYSANTWSTELDFWRGKNGAFYLQRLSWKKVTIPYGFYNSGAENQNWALLQFLEKSPVWLTLAYSNRIQDISLTVYGYLQDRQLVNMYSTVCQSNAVQHRAKQLEMRCSSDEVFTGGPVMKGFQYKMPVVYGVSIGQTNQTIHIHSELFWFACYSMEDGEFDPHCGPPGY